MTNRGLGKGLSALFDDSSSDYEKSMLVDERGESEKVHELSLSSVYANPNQPRKVFDADALEELANSVKEHGIISPIIVNKDNNGRYMIIAGERRYRATKLAGLGTIPAIVKNFDERTIQEISLIENLQREDLNPIEAAYAMKKLMNDYGLTQESLATRIGKSRPAIANTLRLLALPQEVIDLVSTNKLSQGHARTMLSLPEHELIRLAHETVENGYSVRDVEQKVKDYFNPPELEKKKKEKARIELSLELKELIDKLQKTLGTKVSLIGNDKKGRIYIDYYTTDDLDRISDIMDFVEKNRK